MGRGRMRRAGMRRRANSATMFNATLPVTAQLRRAYFAQAADAASRYGVIYERILIHLWRARRRMARLPLRAIAHVEDLVQAIACVDDVALAWSDLIQQNELALVRVCQRRLGDADAIVCVRRLFAELRSQGRLPGLNGARSALSLESYVGVQPLRNWLADRAQGRLGPSLGNAAGSGPTVKHVRTVLERAGQLLEVDAAATALGATVLGAASGTTGTDSHA